MSSRHPVILKLANFVSLSSEEEELLLQIVALARPYERRANVISEGDQPVFVHLVTEGFACRYKTVNEGRRQIISFLLPGDFGDLRAYDSGLADHGVSTLAASKISSIPKAKLVELMEHPRLAKALSMAASVDVAILREWLISLGARSAEERLAYLLCELHARFQNVGLADRARAFTPLTQPELGEAVGLSAVHTNRSLKRLASKGLLSYKNGVFVFKNIPVLRELCGFKPGYLNICG